MWYQENFFKYATALLLILSIVLLFLQISPFFTPFFDFLAVIVFPFAIAGLLYYILRPFVIMIERAKVPRYIAILLIYFFLISIVLIIRANVGPDLADEFSDLINFPGEKIKVAEQNAVDFLNTFNFHVGIKDLEKTIIAYLQEVTTSFNKFVLYLLSAITSIVIAILLTPFLLFYFLKDDYLFPMFFLKFIPEEFRPEAKKILKDIDTTLSKYISGQLTVACLIGLLIYMGYLAIGLRHALILALFAVIFYAIPFIGTFISLIPALIVGLSESWFMAFKVILVVLVAHLIETNLATPNILGAKLQIHPVTLILILLAAGSLFGIIGLLLATPLYAISKVILENLYKIIRLRYSSATKAKKSQGDKSKEI